MSIDATDPTRAANLSDIAPAASTSGNDESARPVGHEDTLGVGAERRDGAAYRNAAAAAASSAGAAGEPNGPRRAPADVPRLNVDAARAQVPSEDGSDAGDQEPEVPRLERGRSGGRSDLSSAPNTPHNRARSNVGEPEALDPLDLEGRASEREARSAAAECVDLAGSRRVEEPFEGKLADLPAGQKAKLIAAGALVVTILAGGLVFQRHINAPDANSGTSTAPAA